MITGIKKSATPFGALVGSAFYVILGHFLSAFWPRWMIIVAVLLIVVVLFLTKYLTNMPVAVLASMALGFLAVIGNYVLPDKLFGYLLATTGAVALFVYLVIAISQIALRRRATEPAPIRMWLFPWLTYAVIAFIVFVIVAMILDPDQRSSVGLSTALAAIVLVASIVHQKRVEKRGAKRGDSSRV